MGWWSWGQSVLYTLSPALSSCPCCRVLWLHQDGSWWSEVRCTSCMWKGSEESALCESNRKIFPYESTSIPLGKVVEMFTRLDPYTEMGEKVSFPRICINAEVKDVVDQKVIVPDEEGNLHEYIIWCEEFPKGCGFCGAEGHLFLECPIRASIKRSSKSYNSRTKGQKKVKKENWNEREDTDDGWSQVSKKNPKKNKETGPNETRGDTANEGNQFGHFVISYSGFELISPFFKNNLILNPCTDAYDMKVVVKDEPPNDEIKGEEAISICVPPFVPVVSTVKEHVITLINDLEMDEEVDIEGEELTLEELEELTPEELDELLAEQEMGFTDQDGGRIGQGDFFSPLDSNDSTMKNFEQLEMINPLPYLSDSGIKRGSDEGDDDATSELKGGCIKKPRFG